MKTFLLSVLLVFTMGAFSAQAQETMKLELKRPSTPAVHSVEMLPKALQLGQEIRVDKSLGSQLTSLLAASDGGAQCQANCDHEQGAIVCPVGRQCYCGCPGGYASCGCK